MPPNEARVYILRWKAEIDQLLTGLNRDDPAAIDQARKTLALIASTGNKETITHLFAAIAAYWENVA